MSAKITSSAKSTRDKKIPVFVFPEELKFIEGDPSSHKQVLTLYNPYDFNIKFEGKQSLGFSLIFDEHSTSPVFSNAPSNYAVVESKGFIKADCCVDM